MYAIHYSVFIFLSSNCVVNISGKENPTMPNKVQPTLTNNYVNGDEEYVFAVKSRPFACLVSPHLPIPTTSLIDYDLISSLGIKMSDLQCQKFYFGGHKMRILGKVSLT